MRTEAFRLKPSSVRLKRSIRNRSMLLVRTEAFSTRPIRAHSSSSSSGYQPIQLLKSMHARMPIVLNEHIMHTNKYLIYCNGVSRLLSLPRKKFTHYTFTCPAETIKRVPNLPVVSPFSTLPLVYTNHLVQRHDAHQKMLTLKKQIAKGVFSRSTASRPFLSFPFLSIPAAVGFIQEQAICRCFGNLTT